MSPGDTRNAIAYLKSQTRQPSSSTLELPHDDRPVGQLFGHELVVMYAIDTGAAYELVQNRHLAADQVSPTELHELGLQNLAKLVGERPTRVQPYGNIFAVLMGGDFEASLLLVDALWDGPFRQFVTGDYAAAIPARDMLAFCDARSEQGIAELSQVIARVFPGGDHLLTDQIYVRSAGRWRPRTSA